MFAKFCRLSLLLTILLLFNNCSNNRMEVDLDKVSVAPIKLKHLDRELFSINEKNIAEKTNQFNKEYGLFYNRYISSFINARGISDSLYYSNLLNFINDKDMKGTYDLIQKTYTSSDFEFIEKEINNGIKRFHYFFPERKLPSRITTCISGFNYAVANSDSTLAIGLDMYLGEKAVYYQMLNLPQYRTRCMTKDYIISDLMRGWLLNEFDTDVPTNTLLNHTIFYGKIYYAVKALAPEVNDSIIIGYTSQQMKYCNDFEKKLWGFMAEKNKLYENNMRTVQELTGEGPFTAAISKECPPGIAKWIGWQIVKSYMDKNEEVSLDQLMKEKDAQKILSKSKYRP